MAYGLPTRGQPDWDDEVNNSVEYLHAQAQAATAAAEQARSNATEAIALAQDAQARVEAISGLTGEDGAVALLVNTPASATSGALSVTIGAAHSLYAVDIYTGFLAGQNSAARPDLWTDGEHLTNTHLRAWADYIVAATKPDGSYIITGTAPKVTWIGNSWIDQGEASILADAVHARIPGATVLSFGTGGQTSTDILARFDTDVPDDTDYVIFNEPGVNDTTINAPTQAVSLANLAAMVRIAKSKGAVPIWAGHVPLTNWLRAFDYYQRAKNIVGDGKGFPSTAHEGSWSANIKQPAPTTIAFGPALSSSIGGDPFLEGPAGERNVAAGVEALDDLTGGDDNTAYGYQALGSLVTNYSCTAIGSRALASATREQNTAIGASAGRAVTTALQNVFIGDDAGYKDEALSIVNATTTGSEQTIIGHNAMGSPTGYLQTAIGSRAEARGLFATAIGAGVKATHNGSVAIGADGAGVSAVTDAANQIVLGTANHTVKAAGYFQIERDQLSVGAAGGASAPPATPSTYLIVKGPGGAQYVVPAYAKV